MANQRGGLTMLEKWEIIVEFWRHGRTAIEIAKERDFPPTTVSSIVHRDLAQVVQFHR